MVVKLLASLAILTASAVGFAQEKKEDWPVGSAVRTLMESAEELERLDIEIDNQNSALIELIKRKKINLDLGLPRAVSDQNDKWKKFRSADCYLGSAIDGGGGAWPEANAISCEVSLSKQRIKLLNSVAKCVEMVGDTQVFDGANCLLSLQTNSKSQ